MPLRPLPPPPNSPHRSSTTFRLPLLDGSLIFQEILEWNALHNASHRLYTYPDEDGKVHNISWLEAVQAIRVGCNMVKATLKCNNIENRERPVVAILALSGDMVTYFTMATAIHRADCIVFPLSPRNSPKAIAHLLVKVNVRHVFLGREQAMSELAINAFEIIKSQNPAAPLPQTSFLPSFEDLFAKNVSETPDDEQRAVTCSRNPDDIIMYFHSSGSTSFPKPIPSTNQRFLEYTLIPHFGAQNMNNVVIGAHSLPPFHAMGISQLTWAAVTGAVIGVYGPKGSPTFSSESLFAATMNTQSDVIISLPVFVEGWSRNPEYVKWLSTRSALVYGGGPLAKRTGDFLVSQGVPIFPLYGLTEGGVFTPIIPSTLNQDWDYFPISENIGTVMRPYDGRIHEIIIVPAPFNTPNVTNMEIDGVAALATSDLLLAHPTKPGYWKVCGRMDDQIAHSTGEKTNPVPIEHIVNNDEHINTSLVFGTGRFMAGILIDPKPEFAFDSRDEVMLAAFRNVVWPTICKANEHAPQHSRIFKEMIIVSNPSKPFEYTGKDTPRRLPILTAYEEEIHNLYFTIDKSTQPNIPPPVEWDFFGVADFVREVVHKVLEREVADEDDLFQHGCDSLQATWIRNALLRALRDSVHIETREATENFVYNYPTIKELSLHLFSRVSGTNDSQFNIIDHISRMLSMVDKYSANLCQHVSSSRPPPSGKVILLTGTTGAFGAHLLSTLLDDPQVLTVYALNRSQQGISIVERQQSALIDRGLQVVNIMASTKLRLNEADLSKDGFGLSPKIYEEMQTSVTHVIHNAWKVDFNLNLNSFEPNLKALRNLIDFSLSSPQFKPPKFLFISSIGIFNNRLDVTSEGPFEEIATDAKMAVGSGYTESKWVAEQLLDKVSRETSLKGVVIRVGQLCGGQNGAWNVKEWFPSLIQSTTVVNCIPLDENTVSWIPIDLAARALVDFCEAELPDNITYAHLVHPRPVRYSALISTVSSELAVPITTYSDWLTKLETLAKKDMGSDGYPSVQLLRNIPALRLMEFFKRIPEMMNVESNQNEAMCFPRLAVTKTLSLSPTLADPNIQPLGAKDVRTWLAYWKKVGMLPA